MIKNVDTFKGVIFLTGSTARVFSPYPDET